MDIPYHEKKTETRMYFVDGVDTKFSVKNYKVDYGDGIIDADIEEYYNFDSINFIE